MAREIRWHEADERDDRRRRHPERELPAIGLQVTEQPANDGRLMTGDERLCLPDRPRDAVGIDAIGVNRWDLARADLELLLQDEPEILERPPLPVGVAHQEQCRFAGAAEDR